jgi:hypothetical protein
MTTVSAASVAASPQDSEAESPPMGAARRLARARRPADSRGVQRRPLSRRLTLSRMGRPLLRPRARRHQGAERVPDDGDKAVQRRPVHRHVCRAPEALRCGRYHNVKASGSICSSRSAWSDWTITKTCRP